MKPTKLTKDQIQATVTTAIEGAVAFIQEEIAPDRVKAQKYFDGHVDLHITEGRSKVVATKCRDTLRAIKPSLMRLFLQSGAPVEFAPSSAAAAVEAQHKTAYARYIFEKNGGFMLLSDVFDDALKKKVGIAKVWREENTEAEIDEYEGLSFEQASFVASDPEVEILEQYEDENGIGMKVSRTNTRGEIMMKAIAPEDFFVDRNSTCIGDAYVAGHSTETRVGDVVAMGFEFDKVYALAGVASTSGSNEEEQQRIGWDIATDESPNDPSMRKVILTEAYMKMDIEGIGVPKLYKFICASDKYTILEYELADVMPFAVFEVDPEAHAFFGRSLVELIIPDQDAATSLLRGLLDNMQMVNNPRAWVVQDQVNMADALSTEIGQVVRMKAPGMMGEFTMGSMAGALLPIVQYYDDVIRGKSGVSSAGMALNTDALASKSATGVMAAMDQSSQVAELIARHLAEGGMKQLFNIVVQLARQNPNPDEMVRVNGEFVPVDPRSWTAKAELVTNVGLGTNKHEERMATMQQIVQTQMGIWQGYGPSNGIVTLTGIRSALADMAEQGGVTNVDKYYTPMNQQIEQQLMEQAAQAAQGQQPASDPNAAFLQAEQMKVSARVQADQQKAQLDYQKALMQDDRERDKMTQDLAIKVAELLGKTGVKLNENAIKAEQARSQPLGMMNVGNQAPGQ